MLIEKLKKYGIQDIAIKWLENYLSDRTQEAKLNRIDGLLLTWIPKQQSSKDL